MKIRKRSSILTVLSCIAFFLVAMITGGVFSSFGRANAYNASNPAPDNSLGEITLKNYEERTDGLVFNPKKLSQLFGKLVTATGTTKTLSDLATAKSKVHSSKSIVLGSAVDATGADVSTNVQDHSLNFQAMKDGLGAPITLKFGGLDWTVVYATTNTTAGTNTQAGDLVVTLWLNDNITTSQWSAATPSIDLNDEYPTNMYSSSYIRVKTLNAGGDNGLKAGNTSPTGTNEGKTYYSTATNSRAGTVTLTERKNNQFAKFTLSNSVLRTTRDKTDDEGNKVIDDDGNPIQVTINPSLTSFLTVPKNVDYQRAENWAWSYSGTAACCMIPNEAWGTGANGPDTTLSHTASETGGWQCWNSEVRDKNVHYEWGQDYLWLPSLTETGFYNMEIDYGVSLWGISQSDAIMNSTVLSGPDVDDISWLRSGAESMSSLSYSISSAGVLSYPEVSSVGGVRPALHLNLSEAAKKAAITAEDTTLTYNGAVQNIKSEKWYDSDLLEDKSICSSIIYTDTDEVETTPKEIGEYYAILKLTSSTPYKWGNPDPEDPASRIKKIKFTIEPKELEVNFSLDSTTRTPKVTMVDQPYTGDTVNATINYYDEAGTTFISTDILDLKGKTKYQAEVVFDNSNYVPDYETSNTTNKKRLIFTNPATAINVVWNSPSTGSAEFSGGAQGFMLKNLNTSLVKASLTQDAIDAGAKAVNEETFSATNVGTYVVDLKLLNDQDYVWGADMGDAKGTTGKATIEFEITPKEIELKVNSVTPSDWSVYRGGKGTLDFLLPPLPPDLPVGTTLAVEVYAQLPGSSTQYGISAPITLNGSTQTLHQVQLDTSNILVLGTYDLGVRIANSADLNAGNFKFKLDKSYKLTIKEPVSSGDIIWQLSADGDPAGSMLTNNTKQNDTYTKSITYDGKKYSFTCTPFGYTVDTSYGTNGYETVKKNTSTALTEVKNAGTYVTTVRLSDGASKFLFSIEWTIDKVVFDLSEVRWLVEGGKISFNEKTMGGSGLSVGLDPKTVPEGLLPQPGGIRTAKNVGDKGTASVTFDVTDKVNYTIPQKGVAGSYIFNDANRTDFDWSMKWEVVEAEIPVDWTIGTIILKNDNNKKINGEVLAGDFDEYVEYDYYETDSAGNKLDPTNPLTEPQVTDGSIRYYVAVAKIKTNYVGSYIFDPNATAADLESPVFEAGNALTGVTLAASKTTYTYWGEPVNFQFTITSGTIAKSAFDIAYYHGMVRLIGAPTDPGTYSACISLKSDFVDSYYIDGTSSFDFTIGCATITEKWNDNVKPSMLNLTENESKYVRYEYSDAEGNIVGISDLRTPGDYNVRAIISDSTKYIFNNNSDTTGWHKFTVNAWDEVPTSPLPPFKDPVDPNDPNGGGSENPGGDKTLITLNYTKSEQTQKVDVTNDVLPDKAFDIKYYNLNGQLVNDYSAAGTYKIVVTLVGEYADSYRIANPEYYFTVSNGNVGVGTTNPDGEGNNPSDGTFVSYLPVILSGISLVLIVVFTVMAFNNASAAKSARTKAKKLATMSYSFAPAGLLLIMGLTETNWWIIAGVLMALALVAGIVAFLFRAKKLKALEVLEEEQTRLAEEKEMAQLDKEAKIREEQIRRDNEMKMMFASMQQSYQQAQQQQLIDYDMLQNMITSAMNSLQTQAALPPASEAQKEMEEFHAQMAAQQEQMAQQQEMLAQILQNQQQASMYAEPEYGNVYEVDDDLSWLGDEDDVISLEESYGGLTETKKRFYYEIGSYIMNHPRTSQNDGKYAVLFKHRGRTICKLAIKEDAPVLYYPTETGGRNDIRIVSSVSLDKAKTAIDRVIARVDSEM